MAQGFARKALISGMVAAALLPIAPAFAQAAPGQPVQPITAEERAQGSAANGDIVAEYGGSYSFRQFPYVEGVARRIALQSGLAADPKSFTVTVLDSPIDNAFAIPGGYVYVTRGLLALMNDEAELASVLGHEVGHVAARHSKKRQQTATRNAIGGTLLQVLAGAVAGNSGLGGLLQKGIGTGAQLLTLGYSRTQETEADNLGVRYLAGAQYDTDALASMLGDLAGKTALEAKLAGKAGAVPAWASTHPDPAARVRNAAEQARMLGGTNNPRNRAAYLAAIDGLLYGDNPQQGVVDGQNFRHPDMKIGFAAPVGYAINNGAAAVSVTGQGGQAQFSALPYAGDLAGYVRSVYQSLSKSQTAPELTNLRRGTVNGLPVASATVSANSDQGQMDATVVAYELGPKQAVHFLTITPQGSGLGPFEGLVGSLHRLSAAESGQVKARYLRVVKLKKGDTVASLAARMAFADAQMERFLTLNGLAADAVLKPGDSVKIVTY